MKPLVLHLCVCRVLLCRSFMKGGKSLFIEKVKGFSSIWLHKNNYKKHVIMSNHDYIIGWRKWTTSVMKNKIVGNIMI